MQSYDALSAVYDLFADDFDHAKWAEYYRALLRRAGVEAKSLVDAGCGTGRMTVELAREGARVVGVDISEEALEVARENAARNGLNARFEAHNCFDLLRELADAGEKHDLVILDPPAFTKSRQAVQSALRGYKEINLRAMKLLPRGGYLATCSCSHFMTYELFTKTIGQAAHSVHKRLRQVEFRTQAPDHPILWAADESYYLKFYIFQVV